MNLATTLRYMNLGNNGYWARRYYIMHDYELMAKKFEFGLCAVISEYDLERIPTCLENVAWTADGVCEAIESKELNIYGTQWHPEQSFHDGSPLEQQFFANFLKKCKECSQG